MEAKVARNSLNSPALDEECVMPLMALLCRRAIEARRSAWAGLRIVLLTELKLRADADHGSRKPSPESFMLLQGRRCGRV